MGDLQPHHDLFVTLNDAEVENAGFQGTAALPGGVHDGLHVLKIAAQLFFRRKVPEPTLCSRMPLAIISLMTCRMMVRLIPQRSLKSRSEGKAVSGGQMVFQDVIFQALLHGLAEVEVCIRFCHSGLPFGGMCDSWCGRRFFLHLVQGFRPSERFQQIGIIL